ncbi:MAG TPA: hypothetical protein VHR66_24190 [Gemmataceae bacterium]|nr:hypothetical protein [Gemmataceae bacterium]
MSLGVLRIEEVVVEHALGAWLRDEARMAVAGHECERGAGFQGAEDADESGFDALFADQLLGPWVLLERTGAVEAGLDGDGLGEFDEGSPYGTAWIERYCYCQSTSNTIHCRSACSEYL